MTKREREERERERTKFKGQTSFSGNEMVS